MYLNYGKCPCNPVNLIGRQSVKRYLDHLVTDKGFHILYHLYASAAGNDHSVIDQFEIMTGEGVYDDLFFNLHHTTDSWIPPDGYLFIPAIELKLLDMPGYDQCYSDEKETDVEEKYLYREKSSTDWEEDMVYFDKLPRLERYLYRSCGEDEYVESFPFPLIGEILDNLDFELSPVMKEWIVSAVKPRRK